MRREEDEKRDREDRIWLWIVIPMVVLSAILQIVGGIGHLIEILNP